jgi:hypothetical protein
MPLSLITKPNMKKTILILLCVCGLGSFAKAQLTSPGIEIGYGGFTPPILNGDAKNRSQFFSNGIEGAEQVTSYGAFHAAVTAKVWKVTVGIEGSYEDILVRNDFGTPTTSSVSTIKVSNKYWTAMGRVQWTYGSISRIKLYSGVAAGIYGVTSTLTQNESSLTPDTKNTASGFAYQATALGACLEGKVSVFLEGGYGFLGIVNGGVRFKL